ncbi:MAG TPA: TPM domain-containing protein [Polyangiales bacterium]
MSILSDADKQRIEAAVAAAEQKTAAEFVVVRVAASDAYAGVRWFAAGLFALTISAALALAFPVLRAGEVLGLQLLLALLAFWITGRPALLRGLTPEALKREAVERAARLAFLEHTLFATRERTGVLILVSEQEHHVAILGDEGIHQRVQELGWQQHVDTIVKAIHAGKAADGVCEVIAALSEVLAHGVSVRADDVNELPNRVR